MTALTTTRIALPTGVTLAVQQGGPDLAEAILFLHGFPESHRTWRAVAPALARDYRVIVPDQRGFGASDKPEGVEEYRTERILEDLIALADALARAFHFGRPRLGRAMAWLAALRHPDRLKRLVIVNSPHPWIFQKSLIEDAAQRAASQYMNAFRNPAMEAGIAAMGWESFYTKTFGGHADLGLVPPEEKAAYLADWSAPGALTAMLNWYRASEIVVPVPGEEVALPAWATLPFPHIELPTLVIWALGDKARPHPARGLHVIDDLRIVTVPDAGHFVPWEQPETVASAIGDFMREAG